jgi:hypothetical protein
MNDFDFIAGKWHVRNRRQDKWLVGSTNYEEFEGLLVQGGEQLGRRGITPSLRASRYPLKFTNGVRSSCARVPP